MRRPPSAFLFLILLLAACSSPQTTEPAPSADLSAQSQDSEDKTRDLQHATAEKLSQFIGLCQANCGRATECWPDRVFSVENCRAACRENEVMADIEPSDELLLCGERSIEAFHCGMALDCPQWSEHIDSLSDPSLTSACASEMAAMEQACEPWADVFADENGASEIFEEQLDED